MSRSFFQAINNFDLSPASFVGASINVLFGVLIAQLAYFGTEFVGRVIELSSGSLIPVPESLSASGKMTFIVALAFSAGYFPELAKRNLVRAARLKLKREETGIYEVFKATPTELTRRYETGSQTITFTQYRT